MYLILGGPSKLIVIFPERKLDLLVKGGVNSVSGVCWNGLNEVVDLLVSGNLLE